MDKFSRIFKLHQLLENRRTGVSAADLMERLSCSRSSLTRVVNEMRLYLNAPIEHDSARGGYYYASVLNEQYQLPGVWFNASELHAMLAVEQLLESAEPGLLADMLQPLKSRIQTILQRQGIASQATERYIRILRQGGRSANPLFATLAGGLMQHKQIAIRYYGRQTDSETERIISPQRLIHYRDNWYLDAWCHQRQALRSFAVENVQQAKVLDHAAQTLLDEELDAHFTIAYGIFAGQPVATAVLRFTAYRARWVADEQWHPQQISRYLEDGRYELRIPYADPHELIMDILKFGPDVEVMAPQALRTAVSERLVAAVGIYNTKK